MQDEMKDVEMTERGQDNIELKLALVYNNTFYITKYHLYITEFISHRSASITLYTLFPNSR